MTVITKEVADGEVKKWLDYKKVKESKRELIVEVLDSLSEAIQDGLLVLNENMTLTQTLKFPITGEAGTEKLIYQPRVTIQDVNKHMKGMKANDTDSKLLGTIAAVTRTPKALIENLDTEDYALAQQIGIFFL